MGRGNGRIEEEITEPMNYLMKNKINKINRMRRVRRPKDIL